MWLSGVAYIPDHALLDTVTNVHSVIYGGSEKYVSLLLSNTLVVSFGTLRFQKHK